MESGRRARRAVPGCPFALVLAWIATAVPVSAAPSSHPGAGALPEPAAAGGVAMPASTRANGDLWFGLAAATVTTVAAFNDTWLTDETTEASSPGEGRLSSALRPAGSLAVVAPAILLAYGAGRLTGHTGIASSARRVGLSVGAASLAAVAIKQIVGRERPFESPGDSRAFQPFSGHRSFPSGHSTIAFATATALVRESDSRWLPWVAYPAAALVGWSRVHDRQHWTSDVVAGAALGTWTANKVEQHLRGPAGRRAFSLELTPERRGVTAALGVRF